MNHILLLGAGFSRNWGGWLAREAFEYLLGSPHLDDDCRELLWEHKEEGFEAALAELQRAHDDSIGSSLARMETAVRQMFVDMNRGFLADDFRFEFVADQNHVAKFLAQFDAIFSLNQDLLLERRYCTFEPPQLLNSRWSGFALPGMVQRIQPDNLDPIVHWISEWCPDPKCSTVAASNKHTQPIYKLHGSSNWVNETNKRLLVLGGNKLREIEGSRILSMYRDEFARRLKQPETRVMIIGYGFRDEHITQALLSAARDDKFKVFIIDQNGVEATLGDRTRLLKNQPYPLQRNIIGASRRTLREIFGEDRAEYAKVMRFFD